MTNVTTVAHIIHRFDTGGLENGVVNIINALPEDNYRHVILTMQGFNPEFAKRIKTNNVEIFDLAKKEGNDFGVFLRCDRHLKQIKPDILHTRNTATIEMQLVGWWRRIPVRIHGEHGWDVNDMHGQNKKYQILRRIMSRFIHRYIALSKEAYEYLRDTIGIDTARISHICNGVDTIKFNPQVVQTADVPSDFLTTDDIVFGSVGRLADVKNHTFLLNAFATLVGKNSTIGKKLKLILVGDGGLKAKLEEQAQDIGIAKNVFFAGDRSDIPQWMSLMDVFILPSLAEGISNTILEAQASGLPVIATNVGGNPELIESRFQTTHIVDSNDEIALANAMQRYVDEPQLLKIDSEIVRQHCEQNFSITTMVNLYHRLYQANRLQE